MRFPIGFAGENPIAKQEGVDEEWKAKNPGQVREVVPVAATPLRVSVI